MNKYERSYNLAAKTRYTSWLDAAVAPLVVDLQDLTGEDVRYSGPFGLRAEVMICIGAEDNRRYLTVTPCFDGDGMLTLHYDTGEKSGRYAPGTCGDWNGFNNVTRPLPDTIEEILALFQGEEPRE